MDKKYVLAAMGWAIVGLLLGIHMAASHNHGQLVTHAHIMLAGFLLSFVYAVCHKLWCAGSAFKLRWLQFILHQAGALVLVTGLFLLYGGFAGQSALDPVLGISSLAILAGVILMKVDLIRSFKAA